MHKPKSDVKSTILNNSKSKNNSELHTFKPDYKFNYESNYDTNDKRAKLNSVTINRIEI